MIAFSALVLALAQTPASLAGDVVDEAGRPLAGIEVVLSCGQALDGTVPTLARVRTDDQGRFRLEAPNRERLGETRAPWGAVWAYRSGKALAGAKWLRSRPQAEPIRLTLDEPGRRTISIKGPDGSPVAGARVAPHLLFRPGLLYGLDLPDDLVQRIAVATGPDGVAELPGIAAEAELLAVRVAAGGASQVVSLDLETEGKARTIAITLKPAGRLVGKIATIDGKPPGEGVALEVWSQPGGFAGLAPVRFDGGPITVGPDGSFRTPPGLRRRSTCRLVARAEGFAPLLSSWVTLDSDPTTVPPLTLRPLRPIAGRVVDRRGRPVADAEVFQAGDGPDPTSARTDGDGRFRLGGYDRDRAFAFAERDGFRFQGRPVDTTKAEDVQIVLTRDDEAPERPMPTLPDPLPRDEMVALSKRVIGPYLERAIKEGSDGDKFWAFDSLLMGDPFGALERAEQTRFERPNSLDTIRGRAALQLVGSDPEEASAVVESIGEPGGRASSLVDLSDAMPDSGRARRIGLLDRAALQAKAATRVQDRLWQTGEVAERLYELGEVDKARSLFAEGRGLADAMADKADLTRGLFAARLARVDLPAALAMIDQLKDKDRRLTYLGAAAWRVATVNPAEAERVIRRIEEPGSRSVAVHRVVRILARSDLPRARALVDLADGPEWRAHAWLFLGEGAARSDRAAALDAFRRAVAEMARLRASPSGSPINPVAIALPLVEAIDPALVPEVFWRALSLRETSFDPREILGQGGDWRTLPMLLARYDREVAALAFAPGLAYARDALPRGDRYSSNLALTQAMIDPRLAVELVESMPLAPRPFMNEPANWSRIQVAEKLGRTVEARWKSLWRIYTGIGLTIYDRD